MIGAAKINFISKFTSTAVAEVIRKKKGVTAEGAAQIDTAQSKFGGSSALFDGTGDRLSIGTSTDLAFGTGNFTIEFWARFNSTSGNQTFLDMRGGAGSSYILFGSDGGEIFLYVDGSYRIGRTAAFSTGSWYHVALARSGTSTKAFVNGTQVGSTYTDSNTYQSSTNPSFGENASGTGFGFNGWMDEIRISKTARYTSNFTSPTAAFTNDNDTLLLIHCNGTDATTYFEDDNGISRSQLGISAHGGATISSTQSKFGGTSLGFGDGASDYYKVYAPTNSYFGGSGDMTFEFWYYRASSGSGLHITDFRVSDGSSWTIVDFEDGRLGLRENGYKVATNFGMPTTTWAHVAIVKQGTSVYWYKNGSLTDTTTGHPTTFDNRSECFIGANYADQTSGNNLNGYIDELRISNIARYTSNFTAPSVAHVNDSNTLLLIHADGTNGSTVIRDDNGSRSQKAITVVGNAQIDTAQSKFGGASALFDGTGDYQSIGDISFGTSQFTIECWFRASSTSNNGILNIGTTSTGLNNTTLFSSIYSGTLYVKSKNGSQTSTSVSTNTWYHLAITRDSSNNFKTFLNGTQFSSTFTDTSNYTETFLYIGAYGDTSTGFNGHLDEIRISNTARYTANFTAPTASFQNDDNTVLLIHADGTDASTVFFDDNGRTTTP